MYNEEICPYCGSSMKEGHVESEGGTGLFWVPKYESLGIIKSKKAVERIGGVILDGPYWTRFNNASILAFYCESCSKIIIKL